MPIAAIARARAMRANAFPGFVTDDVMCYHSPNRRETRKPLPGTEAAYYFITRSSLCKYVAMVQSGVRCASAPCHRDDRFRSKAHVRVAAEHLALLRRMQVIGVPI